MEQILTEPLPSKKPNLTIFIPCSETTHARKQLAATVWQYADDVALIAPSEAALKILLSRMALYCHRRGLSINYDKCHIMEISQEQHLPDVQVTFQGPTPAHGALSINKTDSFTYLGIPIHRDLATHHIKDRACKKAWAAHHAAQRAGMRTHGLPMSSRMIAWKAFVLPHILFYLPFLSDTDLHDIQSTINTSLRALSHDRASPEALHAEIGLIPVKWQWAQALAVMGGRLQTNRRPLRAAAITQALLQSPAFGTKKGI